MTLRNERLLCTWKSKISTNGEEAKVENFSAAWLMLYVLCFCWRRSFELGKKNSSDQKVQKVISMLKNGLNSRVELGRVGAFCYEHGKK